MLLFCFLSTSKRHTFHVVSLFNQNKTRSAIYTGKYKFQSNNDCKTTGCWKNSFVLVFLRILNPTNLKRLTPHQFQWQERERERAFDHRKPVVRITRTILQNEPHPPLDFEFRIRPILSADVCLLRADSSTPCDLRLRSSQPLGRESKFLLMRQRASLSPSSPLLV